MMPLLKRSKANKDWGPELESNSLQGVYYYRQCEPDKNIPPTAWPKVVVACVFLLILTTLACKSEETEASSSLQQFQAQLKTTGNFLTIRRENNNVRLVLDLALSKDGSQIVNFGPHNVQLIVKNKDCQFPRFWMRLTGASLVAINLKNNPNKPSTWTGTFTLPIRGTYRVETRWFGCRGDETIFTSISDDPIISFQANSTDWQPTIVKSMFGGSWLPTPEISSHNPSRPDYMWMDPHPLSTKLTFTSTSDSVVAIQATAKPPNGFYRFAELGNYELLCFMGSATMQEIRREFLEIRGDLFSAQRPFKFHMYDIPSFVRPDRYWDDENKKRLRKCKHVVVALDETVDPTSQLEYMEQVKIFVNHLLQVIPEETFPIWMLTVNESPLHPTNCHSPTLPRTSDHPCNNVLKTLFGGTDSSFPKRVHFLDNTDLTLPQLGDNKLDILAVIALRIYVLVGLGVSVWRDMGQHGLVDGLHRNDTVEHNFELIPYDGWSH